MNPQIYRLRPSGYPDITVQRFRLSTNDLLNPSPVYVPVSLFFSVPDQHKHSTIQLLIAGLRKTLAQCRFLVGTIEMDRRGEYCIVSRRESAVDFIQHVPDQDTPGQVPFPSHETLEANRFCIPDYSDMARLRVQALSCSQNSAAPENKPPVIGFQVNFIPGGIILSIHFHHWAMDYCAFAAIVQQWAGNTYALTHHGPYPDIAPACLDRSRLLRTSDFSTESHAIHHEPVPVHADAATADLIPELAQTSSVSVYLFSLRRSKAEALKASVIAAAGGESCRISSYDAFIALWWRVLTRARAKFHSSENLSAPADFVEAVNIRRKLEPPLPDGYLGNAVLFATAMSQQQKLTIADVMELASLGTIASYIRRISDSVDAAFVERQLNQILERQRDVDGKQVPHSVSPLAFTVNDWRAHNVYNANFGFGKPTGLRHLFGVMPVLVVLPLKSVDDESGETFEFLVPVENEIIDDLVCDTDVREWFEFHGVESEG